MPTKILNTSVGLVIVDAAYSSGWAPRFSVSVSPPHGSDGWASSPCQAPSRSSGRSF
jgi:hypothetical protein